MRTKILTLSLIVVLAIMGTTFGAEIVRPYIGIDIDSAALPALLVKHLKLSEGQGLRIDNVVVGSPADKMGIERDDLLVTLNGEKIIDYKQVVETVRSSNVGMKLTLGIIHLGELKTVEVTLEAVDVENYKWKYPEAPAVVEKWNPGRIFQMQPGDKNWIEIPMENIMPNNLSFDASEFFKQLGTFKYSEKSPDYEITVELNPYKDKATIIVKTKDEEYKVSENEINKLPEKYRDLATKAVKNARQQRSTNALDITVHPEFKIPSMNETPKLTPSPGYDLGGNRLDQIEQQLRQMQERMEQLEKQYREQLGKQKGEAEESTNTITPSQQSIINPNQKT